MSLLIILTSYQYLCCKTRLVVTLTSLASSWSHLSKIFSNPSLLFYYAARSSICYTYSCCTRSCIFWMCLYFSALWCISKVGNCDISTHTYIDAQNFYTLNTFFSKFKSNDCYSLYLLLVHELCLKS